MASVKNEYEHHAVGHSSNWWRGMDRTVGWWCWLICGGSMYNVLQEM